MTQPKVIDREQEIIFTNWTDRDFEHTWNKKVYRFKANKSYYLPFYLAEHFGRHLVTRELNEKAAAEIKRVRDADPRIDAKVVQQIEQSVIGNSLTRQEMMDKCVIITEAENVGIVTPKEVPMREVKLKAQERSENYVAQGRVSPADTAQRVSTKVTTTATDESSFDTKE